jgi:hypothetical protein
MGLQTYNMAPEYMEEFSSVYTWAFSRVLALRTPCSPVDTTMHVQFIPLKSAD